jgi:hypothetical protein
VTFSLKAGTSFPEVFAPDNHSFGAVADKTSMTFRARVAPGAIADPSSFWPDGAAPPGAIDLYTLVLTSDINHVVHAQLSFGAGTSNFGLDYTDALGMPIDPNNPAQIQAIEAEIAGSFSGGNLTTDLNNLFTVGFVPATTGANPIQEFTAGSDNTLFLTANELPAPEPGSLTLLCIGALGLVIHARRARHGSGGRG